MDTGKLVLLENDRISPLDFTLDEMVRLIRSIGLAGQIATGLIRKSYELFKLGPQIAKASARYEDKNQTSESKVDDMDRALKELILKSSARRTESVSQPEMDTYLKALQEKLK
jgi:coenzyme F420-reducing hydrogenase delta subunit